MTLGELIAEAKSIVGENYLDVVLTVTNDQNMPADVNSVQTAEAKNAYGVSTVIMIIENLNEDQMMKKSIDIQTDLIARGIDYKTDDGSILPIYGDGE